MKTYFTLIKYLQESLLDIGILVLVILPSVMVFSPGTFSAANIQTLYAVSHWSLFFVMMIRPLADIFTETKWIRPLVILRKGAGVLSASVIVSFILAKLMVDPSGYLSSIATWQYWSLTNFAVFAHMADLSAIILLATSNNLSKKILGTWWKKIQQLAYVYFYGSALYVLLSYGDVHLLWAMIAVTFVTVIASIKNKEREAISAV